jgi:hypothetical protein
MYLGKFLIFAALCLASTASVAEPSECSYNDLVETYKRDPAAYRALVIECEGSEKAASISATSSPLAEEMNKQGLSKQDVEQRIRRAEELGLYDMAYYLRREMAEMEGTSSPMKSGEREKLRAKASNEWSKFNSQQDEGTSKSKSGSISSAKCPEDQQLTLTKNRRNQLKRDLDSIDEEITSQDARLLRFDERTEVMRKKINSGGFMAQLRGMSSGPVGSGAKAREEYNRTQKAALDQREQERGNLQDTVLINKTLLIQQRMSLEDRLLAIDYDIQILSAKTTCTE